MSLLGLQDYDSDSSEKSSSDEGSLSYSGKNTDSCVDKSTVSEQAQPESLPLPLPDLEVNRTSCVASRDEYHDRTFKQSSIFYNPYLAEERKKMSTLEQHVVLSRSSAEDDVQRKGEKQNICWKFRKGKCKFGDHCKFSHDVSNNQSELAKTSSYLAPVISRPRKKVEPSNSDDEQDSTNQLRKRKVGVTDSLIPPKRALKAYEKQKSI